MFQTVITKLATLFHPRKPALPAPPIDLINNVPTSVVITALVLINGAMKPLRRQSARALVMLKSNQGRLTDSDLKCVTEAIGEILDSEVHVTMNVREMAEYCCKTQGHPTHPPMSVPKAKAASPFRTC